MAELGGQNGRIGRTKWPNWADKMAELERTKWPNWSGHNDRIILFEAIA